MLRLTLRNVAASRLRFVLTTFAVFLGVSFVVASFVLTDGLLDTFDNIVEDANEGIDVQVRARSEFAEIDFGDRPIDEGLLDDVLAVEGVEEAEPFLESFRVRPVDGDGEVVESTGAPIISFNWSDSELDGLDLVAGTAPSGPGEFVIDVGAADRENLEVGGQYDIIGKDGREAGFTLVGTARFGDENALAGAILMFFTLDELQRLDGQDGLITEINVAATPGTGTEELISRLNDALPGDVEAVSGAVVTSEDQDDFSEIITIFGNILLGFALVAVFVSVFIIGNTFNILLGRRVRQLALLRALGASTSQIRSSSLLEAAIIGTVASVLGLGGGVLLALGLREVMNLLGLELPAFDLIIAPRTIVVALVVGLVVTLMAAFSPARRAANVPPVSAMREGFRFGSGEGTRRTIIAIVLSVLGVALLGMGLFGGSDEGTVVLGQLGLGAVLVFVAVSMFMPLFSTPTASFLGIPLEHPRMLALATAGVGAVATAVGLGGWGPMFVIVGVIFLVAAALEYAYGSQVTGHMARGNASRDNKQTARTASGLMIGLALVAMATVVATSLKETLTSTLGSSLTADFLVLDPLGLDFSNELAGKVDALDEFDAVSAVRYGSIRVDGDEKEVLATDLTLLTSLVDIDVSSGDPAEAAGPESVVIYRDVADDNNLAVGDELVLEFAATGEQTFTVSAIYDQEFFLMRNYMIDLSGWEANFDADADSVIAATVTDGVDESAAVAALEPLADEYPQLDLQTRDEFADEVESQLDSLLIIINVFLGLAIIIALLGIANTMALSVLERTREIGLMRAIGMTRPQTRGMIALEAAVVSLFGALLGVVVGLAFGWLAVTAIPDSFIEDLAIPGRTLLIYVVVATVAGLLAALIPARRAARLNVLEAITHM